jgi:hypothetical protein
MFRESRLIQNLPNVNGASLPSVVRLNPKTQGKVTVYFQHERHEIHENYTKRTTEIFFVFFLLFRVFRVKKVKTKYLFTRLEVLHFAIDLLQRTTPLGVQCE